MTDEEHALVAAIFHGEGERGAHAGEVRNIIDERDALASRVDESATDVLMAHAAARIAELTAELKRWQENALSAPRLDGYRELGARAAQAETERDEARAVIAQVRALAEAYTDVHATARRILAERILDVLDGADVPAADVDTALVGQLEALTAELSKARAVIAQTRVALDEISYNRPEAYEQQLLDATEKIARALDGADVAGGEWTAVHDDDDVWPGDVIAADQGSDQPGKWGARVAQVQPGDGVYAGRQQVLVVDRQGNTQCVWRDEFDFVRPVERRQRTIGEDT